MRALRNYLRELKIGLVDVGARGGLEPRWRSIERNVKAFLFEPDERSCQEIKTDDHVEEIFPMGLGASETNEPLNLCRSPGVSSLLLPRQTFLSRFPDAKRFDVIAKETIRLSTLDKCLMGRWEDCDFIKIDTQGTELDILEGGGELLDSPIIGLEIEVEFIRLYEEQPLFGDICSHLERKGYEFFDFVNICRWERGRFTSFGQAVFGDGLFLRSPETFAEILGSLTINIARSKAKKYIAIAALYDHIDLLKVCIDCFRKFFNAADLKAVENLHAALLRRRRFSSFILRVTDILLRPLGIRATGLQTGISSFYIAAAVRRKLCRIVG